jgi:rhamnose utilization protein RhaD (predicted bifunctional aldolase and dehydrogenase)
MNQLSRDEMSERTSVMRDLVRMSRMVGQPEEEHVILGEGNTSAAIDEHSFFVKGSGEQLGKIDESGFVEIDFRRALALLDESGLQADELKAALSGAKVTPEAPGRPSIEVLLHAVVLREGQSRFVAHTHTTIINALLCSDRAEEFAHARVFPDQVVVCGPDSVFIPYTDPGIPLGRVVHHKVEEYKQTYGIPPRALYLKNHGAVVMGNSVIEVEQILAMCTKAAKVFAQACAIGEPILLEQDDIDQIYGRSDEHYRREKLLGR